MKIRLTKRVYLKKKVNISISCSRAKQTGFQSKTTTTTTKIAFFFVDFNKELRKRETKIVVKLIFK